MLRSILASSLLLIGASAKAADANWIVFANTTASEEWYADANSYKEISPTIRRIWAKQVLTAPDSGIKVLLAAWEFDCLRGTFAIPSGTLLYGKDGKYLETVAPQPHALIPPGTIASIMRDQLCTIPAAIPSSTRSL